MEIIEGKLYFIKDKFIEKYNPKYHLMENKETGTKRPSYFVLEIKLIKIYCGSCLCLLNMTNIYNYIMISNLKKE